MDYIIVKVPLSVILSNEGIRNLALFALLGGAKSEGTDNDGITTYSHITNRASNYALLTYDVVKNLIDLGSQVLNYQSFVKVNIDDKVPDCVRDSDRTWREWISDESQIITIRENTWISGYAHENGYADELKPEKHLTGTEIIGLIELGYEVLNKSDFQTLRENE